MSGLNRLPSYLCFMDRKYSFLFFLFWKVRKNPQGPNICSSIYISSIIPGEKHQKAVYTMFACMPSLFSRILLFETLGTLAHQAPLSWTLQARILEWVTMPSTRGSSKPRDHAKFPLHFFSSSTPLLSSPPPQIAVRP